MIRTDFEGAPEQVLFEVPKEVHDGEKFLPGDTVVTLSTVKRATCVSNDAFSTLLPLGQNGADGVVGGVRVEGEFSFVIRHRQDRRRGECDRHFIERPLCLL